MPRLEEAKSLTEADGYLLLDFGKGRTKKLRIDSMPESTVEHIRSVIKGREAAQEAIETQQSHERVQGFDLGGIVAGMGTPVPGFLARNLPTKPGESTVDPAAFRTLQVAEAPTDKTAPLESGDPVPAESTGTPRTVPVTIDTRTGRQTSSETVPAPAFGWGTAPVSATAARPETAAVDTTGKAASPGATHSPPGATPRGRGGSSGVPSASLPKPLDFTASDERRRQLDEEQRTSMVKTADAEDEYRRFEADQHSHLQDFMDELTLRYNDKRGQNRVDTARAITEYRNSSVDPGSLWSNAGTGQKIAAGLGMIIGGIGAGLTGQPNLAVKIVNDAIDRDIDAQKTKIAQNKEAIALMRQQGIDLDDWFDRKAAMAKSMVAGQLMRAADQRGLVAERERAKQAAAQWERAATDRLDAAALRNLELRQRDAILRTDMKLKAGQAALQQVQVRNLEGEARARSTIPEKHGPTVQWTDGNIYEAVDEEAAKKARAIVQQYDIMKDAYARMHATRTEYGREVTPWTQGAEDAKREQGRVREAFKQIARLVGEDDGTASSLGALSPDVSSVWLSDDGARESINRVQNEVLPRLNAASKSLLKVAPASARARYPGQ